MNRPRLTATKIGTGKPGRTQVLIYTPVHKSDIAKRELNKLFN